MAFGDLKVQDLIYEDGSNNEITVVLANLVVRDGSGDLVQADNKKFIAGTGSDLEIYHNGTRNYIDSKGSQLRIETDELRFRSDGGETYAQANVNGAFEAHYDNVKKFETTSGGISITGGLLTTTGSGFSGTATFSADVMFDGTNTNFSGGNTAVLWDKSDDRLEFADSTKLSFGQSYDLQIYHSPTLNRNYIDVRNGNLSLRAEDSITFEKQDSSGANQENLAKFLEDGACELYYDGGKKFETKSYGVKVGGDLWLDDDNRIKVGSSGDLQIYHDGTGSYIDNDTGELQISNAGNTLFIQPKQGENSLKLIPDGAVEIYYNGSKKLETTSGGVAIDGDLKLANGSIDNALNWGKTASILQARDSTKLTFGNANDLEIYHDGSHSYIDNTGTGHLYLKDAGVIKVRTGTFGVDNADGSETMMQMSADGAVDLYYDGVKKLETTSGGVNVTGALTINGSPLAGGLSSDAQKNTVGGTNAGNSFTGTDANDNTLIGYDAGTGITTGDKNTSLGVRANEQGTTGSNNTAIGYEALRKLTDGGNNVAVGNNAGFELTTGGRNVAIGAQCLKESTSGTGTVAIGWQASQENRGNYNVAIGYVALKGTGGVTGYNNVAIGLNAGTAVTSGYSNVFIGDGAGSGAQTSMLNIAIGAGAGSSLQHVGSNTFVGRNAGAGVTTGGPNLLLGWNAGQSASPSGAITTGSNIVCLGGDNVTDLYCQDTSISSSDSRDKADITNFTHGLSWINKLNPVTYRWDKRTWYNEYNEDGSLKTEVTSDGSKKRARQHIGFLAQDVLAIEQADGFASKKDDMLVVNLNEDDSAYGLKYERLVPVLVNAIKELSTEVNTLKTKVAALEAA